MKKTQPKSFQNLREWLSIQNTPVTPIAPPQAVDDVDNAPGVQSVENQDNLDKLNAYVSGIGLRPYMNPYYPLNELWAKLHVAGLNFDLRAANFFGQSGTLQIPLTQFGGRFGFLDQSGQVKQDDGISSRVPGGMSLVLSWVNVSGLYNLSASIERNS